MSPKPELMKTSLFSLSMAKGQPLYVRVVTVCMFVDVQRTRLWIEFRPTCPLLCRDASWITISTRNLCHIYWHLKFFGAKELYKTCRLITAARFLYIWLHVSCIRVKNHCHRVTTQLQLNKYYYYILRLYLRCFVSYVYAWRQICI
jgi:hypothetical protein